MSKNVVTISDTVVGYGSPQILDFTRSMSETTGGRSILVQPLVPQRPVLKTDERYTVIETVPTACHPYSFLGRQEYLSECAKIVNAEKPRVLIITNYILFDIFEQLKHKPRIVIHLALEDLEPILAGEFPEQRLRRLKHQAKNVGIWLFPERNRAVHDCQILGIPYDKIHIFYNVANSDFDEHSKKRNGRLIYSGTLDIELSVGRYIFEQELAPYPIDVYGDLQGSASSKSALKSNLKSLAALGSSNSIRWFGQIPGKRLDSILPEYTFSIVFWMPVRHALLNAAPNKFFQAIANGVPVVSAPHPQCKMLIERYNCGIVLDGWEKSNFLKGVEAATSLASKPGYQQLVDGCRKAVACELSWTVQFGRFIAKFKLDGDL
ncbi:hypothetical protein [Permianibacter aggregans]|uniref:Glycosyltransferase involved in cell wall biosynthesis n=1 Tax=Permianibacter aggregans TaxID=1510150 RepID=A0A4R6UUS3_9GAMM|nr:hypothetical protein [Permianibacter aggregans]QGX41332.1 hypothetical protein E2H98_17330 [Permianibacter aggregans]TDQ51118.1 glycosyltransferase involved in cell wall biosynthesis [Permianibacter aggregans]